MAYQKLQASRALVVHTSDTIDVPNPAGAGISSTTTGAAAGKLIDTTQDFIESGVKIGDIIYSGGPIVATVTAVDSATQLSVTTAVSTARAYTIYNAPNIPNNGCVLYVGGAGDLNVVTSAGDEVVFTGVLAGSFIPVQITRVKATSTTATGIIALW
jgi:hypothetical protein